MFYIAKFTLFAGFMVRPEAPAFGPAASNGGAPAAFHTVKRTQSGKTCARQMGRDHML